MLLSKRIIENAKITANSINVDGVARSQYIFKDTRDTKFIELKVGLDNMHPCLLLGPIQESGEEPRYIPYTIYTNCNLGTNGDEYIKAILGATIWKISGLNLHLFGLFYQNEMEGGVGMVEGNMVKYCEGGTVALQSVMLKVS